MNSRTLAGFVTLVSLLIVGLGLAAGPQQDSGQPPAGDLILSAQATTAGAISYQGRLTNAAGAPLNETVQMRFQLYDLPTGGTVLWDSGNLNVVVERGLFNVVLQTDPELFNGQALWLRQNVGGEWLSPRQEILPAPYALSLRPGAQIAGPPSAPSGSVVGATIEGNWPAASAVSGFSVATGTAGHFQSSGGQGVYAYSDDTYGVWGASDSSWGGYFASNEGYGIRASSAGSDHWDHAAYFSADSGYGLYANSAQNMAIRGEAGDTTGLWKPVGYVGAAGIGQSRGLYGSGGSSYGVYGTSLNWYGIYGRTSRGDNNYGLYTPDNLYASNATTAGATMQVAQNGGAEALQPGDVVVFSGLAFPIAGDQPIVQVARTNDAGSQAVAGVVHSRFNYAVVQDGLTDEQLMAEQVEITPSGLVAPGEYLLLVIQGPAQVRVEALDNVIQPGDLLSTSDVAGFATRAPEVEISGARMAPPGVILGKALQPSETTEGLIYVFVTLQ